MLDDEIRIGEYVYVKINGKVCYGEVVGRQEIETFDSIETRYLIKTKKFFRNKYIDASEDAIYRED